jgi:hypothetical protein
LPPIKPKLFVERTIPSFVAKRVPVQTLGARNSDPITSHDAAQVADAASHQNAILRALEAHGAMTEEEVSLRTGIPRTSLSPHFKPLIRKGLIQNMRNPDGTLMKRPNPTSGVMALVRGLK